MTNGWRVPVTEGNRLNLRWGRRALETLGLPIDTAVDDERAAKMVSEKSNDLFLMACLMPSMDGFVCKPLTRQALLQAMVRWFSADAV